MQKKEYKNTKAVMPAHYGKGLGDINNIYKFAKKYDLS